MGGFFITFFDRGGRKAYKLETKNAEIAFSTARQTKTFYIFISQSKLNLKLKY